MNDWYKHSRRRYLLDFHIDSWNDEFLKKFDPELYADCVKSSGATAATFFANTHTGLTNYPTAVGAMHPAWNGRDVFKETVDALHRRGVNVVVYYCLVFVADYWNKHPECRVTNALGEAHKLRIVLPGQPRRFAVCCFNDAAYREFAREQIAEICRGYDFEGVWPDMTFWPDVCYCENCRERYRRETGEEIPQVIDWRDPAFVRFVNTRKRWLVEFAQEVTDLFKAGKPGVTVAQQSNQLLWCWVAGGSNELAECWDWMSADRYSDRYDLSYSGKVFYALSKHKPFERINCWNVPNIHEHTTTRTQDEMRQIALSTIMNDGALKVIDQIDPSGQVHVRNYAMMTDVYREVERYEPYLGGRFRQEVGVYYSLYNTFNPSDNGKRISELAAVTEGFGRQHDTHSHMNCCYAASVVCTKNHLPYGVVTRKDLDRLGEYKVVILPNALMIDEREAAALRRYVAEGGCLYASGDTATITSDGCADGNFLLSDLFGVKRLGRTAEETTYLSPTERGAGLFADAYSADFPLCFHGPQTVVERINPAAEVLATCTLPYAYPREDRHGSILTDPPGRFTDRPALILNRVGKGRVVYCTAPIETETHVSQQETFYRVLRLLCPGPYCVETKAHPAVEITRFEQPESNRSVLHLINYQQELPNLPVFDIPLSLATDGRSVARAYAVNLGLDLPVEAEADGRIRLTFPRLENYDILMIEYAQ